MRAFKSDHQSKGSWLEMVLQCAKLGIMPRRGHFLWLAAAGEACSDASWVRCNSATGQGPGLIIEDEEQPSIRRTVSGASCSKRISAQWDWACHLGHLLLDWGRVFHSQRHSTGALCGGQGTVRGMMVENPSAWAIVFSVFSRIQEKTMAKLFEVCQLHCPEPCSPKFLRIMMHPRDNSTEH